MGVPAKVIRHLSEETPVAQEKVAVNEVVSS
jgi:hypothetical protein